MLSTHDQDLSPKAKVSYDENKFQVEFNVTGYTPEELSIKTEGDVLIVLAKHETKTESGASFVSKQFEQRFSLPSGVKPECITSSLSRDGILVVTAPREQSQHHLVLHNNNNSKVTVNESVTKDEGLPVPKVKYDDDKFNISLDCRKYKPEELDVKVDGNTIVITAKQEIKEQGGVRTRVFEQKFSLPSGVKPENVSSHLGRDGNLVISAPRGNTAASISRVEQQMDRIMSPSSWSSRPEPSIISPNSSSIITSTNTTNFPLKINSHDVNDDDNKIRILTENDTYKILVNVSNYKPEELNIKTVGNSVHIEAKHEEKTSDGRSFSSRNFSQTFILPRGINPESVVSSLSKDGTLTVSAPLPKLSNDTGERLVPIKHS